MLSTNDKRPRTVVLLQYTGIGDLIWHVQYFKAIAGQSQGGQVTIVAQPSTLTRALIGKERWVEAVIDHDHRPRREEKRRGRHAGLLGMWRMAQQLKQGRFDRIVLFSGRISRGLVAALSGIPLRIGFGYKPLQRICLNQGPFVQAYQGPAVAAYHEATDLMLQHGFCSQPIVPRLDVPDELLRAMQQRLAQLPRPLYALAIGTSETHKQWGIPSYAELAQRLLEQGAGVLLLGGPAEVRLAREIEALIPSAVRHGLAVLTDAPVLGSAAALKVADVCVGNDTGMVNVAAAVATPTFVLIGHRRPLDHDPAHLFNVQAETLAAVSVEQVLELATAAAFKAAVPTAAVVA